MLGAVRSEPEAARHATVARRAELASSLHVVPYPAVVTGAARSTTTCQTLPTSGAAAVCSDLVKSRTSVNYHGPAHPPKPPSRLERFKAWVTANLGPLIVGILVVLAGALVASSREPGEPGRIRAVQLFRPAADSPVRIGTRLVEPELFTIAFATDIGVPEDGIGWRELLAKGGIDVYRSGVRLTLANTTNRPVTVTDVQIRVVASREARLGSLAYEYSQGGEELPRFSATIESSAPGSATPLVLSDPGGTRPDESDSYFSKNYLELAPGEIYEAAISIEAPLEEPTEISYELVASGSTAERFFTTTGATKHRVSSARAAEGEKPYAHEYVRGFLDLQCPGSVPEWARVPGPNQAWDCA